MKIYQIRKRFLSPRTSLRARKKWKVHTVWEKKKMHISPNKECIFRELSQIMFYLKNRNIRIYF